MIISGQEQGGRGTGGGKDQFAAAAAPITGLPKDPVANAPHVLSIDKDLLTARVGRLPPSKLELMLSDIDTALGR